MPNLRLSLAQIDPVMGDLEANRDLILGALQQARSVQADLVVFPELALCGYPPEDLLLKASFLQDLQAMLQELLPAMNETTVVLGLAREQGGKVYNAATLIDQGRILDHYHKTELPNYGVFDEKRYFTSGQAPLLFELNRVRIGLTICEDIWMERGPVETALAPYRPDLVLNLSASPFHAGKRHLRQAVVTGLARRLQAQVAYINLVGGQDELVFDGGSLVAGSDGRVLAHAPYFQDSLLTADLTWSEPSSRPELKRFKLSRSAPPRGALVASPVPELDGPEEIHSALVLGTRDYVRKNGFQTVVVGLSGGVDSALTAAIAVDALGPQQVVGVTMPSVYTSAETRTDAEQLARNLGIRLLTLPIQPIFQTYLEQLRDAFRDGPAGIENENLQARIRGNLLMAFSNRYGWLVLTTGNKSETAVGYCTLYGDMAGGFAVIKDVFKTRVYELSRYVNAKAGRSLIPGSVLDRPPTAELRAGQTDQDTLPPYPLLDGILKAYVEEDLDPEAIIQQGFPRATVREVVRMVDRSEYKRRQAPPGVKITPKAFGRDRRLPVTNRYTNYWEKRLP